MHHLLDMEELAGKLGKDGKKYPGMLLHTCGELKHECTVTEENVSCFESVLKQESFCEDYRQNIRKKLLLYYESQNGQPEFKGVPEGNGFPCFCKGE